MIFSAPSLEPLEAVTVEPVSLAQAKGWLGVDHDFHDELIESLVSSARETVEEHAARSMVRRRWRMCVPCWPWRPEAQAQAWDYVLPGPYASLVGVEVVRPDGTAESVTGWALALGPGGLSRLVLPPAGIGSLADRPDAVRVELQAGPTAARPYLRAIDALKMAMAEGYEHREASGAQVLTQTPRFLRMVGALSMLRGVV